MTQPLQTLLADIAVSANHIAKSLDRIATALEAKETKDGR